MVLRTELDTKYGMEETEKASDTQSKIATAEEGAATAATGKSVK
jgi:hypothetical protein